MTNIIAVYSSGRDAKEHAERLNEQRQNGEVFGCRRTQDGRWEVVQISIRKAEGR
jgi:hypothetical protein